VNTRGSETVKYGTRTSKPITRIRSYNR
jgi:hypothetical protein